MDALVGNHRSKFEIFHCYSYVWLPHGVYLVIHGCTMFMLCIYIYNYIYIYVYILCVYIYILLEGLFIDWFIFFSRQVLFFLGVPGSMLSCFSDFLLFCFSASLPASLLFLLLCFLLFLLLCFSASLFSLLLCFCTFVPFYFYYSTFFFFSHVFLPLYFLLLCFFASCLSCLFVFHFILLYSVLFVS